MSSLLALSREIAALAQAGLAFTKDAFDKERFERLREIASELLRTEGSRADFAWPAEVGYPTPKVDIRSVVFRNGEGEGEGEVLLVKERSSGLWTVPGGWADVNLSPAQNAEKECVEESGYRVKARAITSVLDRDQAGYPHHPHAVYKIYLLCDLVGGRAETSIETSEVGFFPLDALPPLDLHRNAEREIRVAYAFNSGAERETRFN